MATSNVNFCFFLDGLDEYEGKPMDIIRLVELLKSMLKVKVCVSSRPWNEFEKVFGQDESKKLYMHDLTRGDIELYVRDTLENDAGFRELKERDSNCLNLVQDVVDAAKGVFLWVFLVVRSLLEGLTNADRIIDLQRRLRLLPTDLNDYFERILFTVDNFYRTQTAQMFRVTLMAKETLPSLCYWFIDQEDPSLMEKLEVASLSQQENGDRLRQIHKRLNACCKGLLEVASNAGDQFPKVDFLHRTVRDFLRIPEMQKLLDKWTSEGFDEHIAICEAIVCVVKTTPQEESHFQSYSPIINLLNTLFYHILMLEINKSSLTTEVRILDELDKTLKKLADAVDAVWDTLYAEYWGGPISTGELSILNIAALKGLRRYLQVKVDGQSLSISEQSDLFLAALSISEYQPRYNHRLEVVSFLLEQGFDPNLAIESVPDEEGSTVWVYFLINYKSRKLDTYDIIRAFLIHGADINAKVSGSSAADAVRELVTEDEARELAPLLPWVPMAKAVRPPQRNHEYETSIRFSNRVSAVKPRVSERPEDDFAQLLLQEALKQSGRSQAEDKFGNRADPLIKTVASDDTRIEHTSYNKQMPSEMQEDEGSESKRKRFIKSLFGRKQER